MEFENIYRALWALLGCLFWCVDYFNIFKMPSFKILSNSKKRILSPMKSVVAVAALIAWGFIGYALMGPRLPLGFGKSTIEVNDVYLIVDVSRSMLAEDFRPNRLEAAKERIKDFVKLRPTDRIGVIMFSEKAFTLLPLSTDIYLIGQVINDINVGFLGMGTNIGDALALGVARLAETKTKNKVIVLLTDGVSNVGSMTPIQAAEEAAKQKVKVYTIGIGGEKNSKVLQLGFGRYQNIPGGSVDYKGLEEIAKMTGGKAYLAQDSETLKSVMDEIQKLEKTKIEKSGQVIYKELYLKYLLIGGCLLIAIELFRTWGLREPV